MAVKRNQTSWVQDLWRKRDGTPSASDRQGLRYRAVYVDKLGKSHTKAFRTKADAQRYLDHNTAAVVAGTWIDPARSGTTFGQAAEQWFAMKQHRKPKTVVGYRSILDHHVLPRWSEVPLRDIDYPDVQAWVSSLSLPGGSVRDPGKGLSASRVKQTHQLMGAVFKYAVQSKMMPASPSAGVELPRVVEKEQTYLSHDQVRQLADGTDRFRVAVFVLAFCGLRFGEMAALRVGSVDLAARRIRVRSSVTAVAGQGLVEGSPKNHASRGVPIPAFLVELLRDHLVGIDDPDALVFPGKRGAWLPLGEFRWAFDQSAGDAGLDLTPHDLRHTAASLAISAGANVKVLQTMLGHKTATMTLDRYGHLFPDDLDQVASALDAAYRAATRTAA